MPVLRKRETIRTDRGATGPIQSGRVASAEVAKSAAAQAANMARQYAQIMGVEARREGEALAKAAVFSTGPGGAPQMPPNAAEKMGRLARQSYDDTMEERYLHQLTTAMRAQISDAESANLHDFDAFVSDAEGRLAGMAADIPPGLEGAFQQISTGLMADAGASIGRRNASVQHQNARAQQPVMTRNASEVMKDQIAAGNMDGARVALGVELDRINRTPAHIMDDGQKDALRDQMLYDFGWNALLHEKGIDDLKYSEIQELQERMDKGEDAELLKYFTDPNGNVRRDLMEKAQYELNTYAGRASRREQAAVKRQKDRAQLSVILRGGADMTKPDQALLDEYFSRMFGFTDPNNPGAARSIDMTDWARMDEQMRADALAVTKTAGAPSATLKQALNRLARVEDPDELIEAFPLLRDLHESPNTAGQTVSFAEHIPERLEKIYQLASVLHGDGGPYQESVADAIRLIDGLGPEWNDELLARKMNADNRWLDGRSKVTADTARASMSSEVKRRVFEGVEARPDEKDQAIQLFETYYRLDHGFDKAIEMTRQSFEGRYVESTYMAGAVRSAYAPEKHYKDPGAKTMKDLFGRIGSHAKGRLLDAVESGAVFWKWMAGAAGYENIDFGGGKYQADPFAVMAHEQIKEMIADHPILAEAHELNGFLEGGKDYTLTPDTGAGNPPIYNVWMGDILVGTLDIREEWAEFQRVSVSAEALTQTAFRRGQAYLLESGEGSEEIWRQVFEDAREGRDTDFEALLNRSEKANGRQN